ncbi:MAG: SRPBCC family protein [Thermoanaerobaculia bacterium]
MRFTFESTIPCTPERLFAFHELPDALQRLTPPWEQTRILRPAASLRPGSRVIEEIRIAPFIWIRAEAVHTVHEPPFLFEDEMVSGPFRRWRHRHAIAAEGDGARLTDSIEFEPPFGFLGRVFAPWLILPRLRRLFAWRHEVTRAWCMGE